MTLQTTEPMEPKDGVKCPGAGGIDSCEPPDVTKGN